MIRAAISLAILVVAAASIVLKAFMYIYQNRKANELGLVRKPWVKSSFAPGSKVARLYLEEAGLLPEMEKLGFGIVAYACTTCNGMSGALDPAIQKEIIERDLYTTAVLSVERPVRGVPPADELSIAFLTETISERFVGTDSSKTSE